MPCRFVTCGPNEALVVSGCCVGKSEIIVGGRRLLWSMFQCAKKLSLNTMTIIIESSRIYSRLGAPVTVTGVAQVKINSSDNAALLLAAEHYLGKTETEIANIAKETLEAHQRSIIGDLTVEEIFRDRSKFVDGILKTATEDLLNISILIVSYTIKDVHDDMGYFEALGKARTAQVHSNARICEAEAARDSFISEALAQEATMKSTLANEAEKAGCKCKYLVSQHQFDAEVSCKKAESDFAHQLQTAITGQHLKEETMQVEVVERTQSIHLQALEVERKQKQLEASVKKPAEAEMYRVQKMAEANKNKTLKATEAEAEAKRLRGLALAESLAARSRADTEQLMQKAEAYRNYEEAAKLDVVLSAWSKVASAIARHLATSAFIATRRKTTVIYGGKDEIGVSKLTEEVLKTMKSLNFVNSWTGLDPTKIM